MRQHNLVLRFDYTEEATSYHTLDMSMWGAVKYRCTSRPTPATLCSLLPLITRRRRLSIRQRFRFIRIKASSQNSWYDPHAPELAHWLCDRFADVIAPVSFVMLSYMDEWALAATRKNRARKEATKLFVEAKFAEVKSWFDNDVFDLVDTASSNPRISSQAGGCADTQKRSRWQIPEVQGLMGLARLSGVPKRYSTIL